MEGYSQRNTRANEKNEKHNKARNLKELDKEEKENWEKDLKTVPEKQEVPEDESPTDYMDLLIQLALTYFGLEKLAKGAMFLRKMKPPEKA